MVFVRPMLEYCSAVSNPHCHCDIVKIESVQRFIGALSYSERLGMLRAESVELRRLKSHLTLIYRIVHSLSAVDSSAFLHYVTPVLWASDEINETVLPC